MNSLRLKRSLALSAISFLVFIAACGDGRPSRVPISGQVLFNGKPFTFGYVRFVPKGARQASGKLDQNGRFTLSSFTENDGVVIGTHAIEVVVSESISETKIRWHAPMKYKSVTTSGLTQEVTAPKDDVVINLESDGKKYPYIQTVE